MHLTTDRLHRAAPRGQEEGADPHAGGGCVRRRLAIWAPVLRGRPPAWQESAKPREKGRGHGRWGAAGGDARATESPLGFVSYQPGPSSGEAN